MIELLWLLLYLNVGLVFATAVSDEAKDGAHFASYTAFWPVVAASLVAAFDVLLVAEIVRAIREKMDEPPDGAEE